MRGVARIARVAPYDSNDDDASFNDEDDPFAYDFSAAEVQAKTVEMTTIRPTTLESATQPKELQRDGRLTGKEPAPSKLGALARSLSRRSGEGERKRPEGFKFTSSDWKGCVLSRERLCAARR